MLHCMVIHSQSSLSSVLTMNCFYHSVPVGSIDRPYRNETDRCLAVE
jgi:hypothetical protein